MNYNPRGLYFKRLSRQFGLTAVCCTMKHFETMFGGGRLSKREVAHDSGTLFHQAWMMDAASKGRWHQIEIRWDNVVVATLPYIIERKFGIRTVGQPYYTHVLGPILRLPHSKPSRQLENSTKLISQLLARLPPHDRFKQVLAPEYDLTAAFVLSGLRVDADYTFRLVPEATPESVMAAMKGAQRRNIAATFEVLTCRHHHDLDEFFALARIQTRGVISRYRFDLIAGMFEAAAHRGQATIISLYDQAGENMGTTVLLHDHRTAYFWLSTRHVEPGNRAYARLIWEAYKFSRERGLIFDFDGYPSTAGAQYLSNFGGSPVIRNRVLNKNLRFDAMDVMDRFARGVRSLEWLRGPTNL